jgi:putative phosphoribosyl transferase
MENRFKDRYDAGRRLAEALKSYGGRQDVIVLALPRGGVPVGYEVARALGAVLDILIVRKLGVPSQPELAMGAIASGGALYINEEIVSLAGVSPRDIKTVLEKERHELARREALYRGLHPGIQIEGRTVIIVDDGIATGATMHAAIMALRSNKPARIVVAVPVCPAEAATRFKGLADDFVCVLMPEPFGAVGQFYEWFDQTSDDEVRNLFTQGREAAS